MISVAAFREPRFDPLVAGQAVLGCLREATERPGHVVPLGDIPLVVPPPHLRAACAVLLAVLDRELTFHVTGPGAAAVREYLHFNTGAHSTDPEDAGFVLVTGASCGDCLHRATRGTRPGSHDGVVVVYAPTELQPAAADADVVLALSTVESPGDRRLAVRGVAGSDFERMCAGHDARPRFDIWFATVDGRLCAIPRSARWRVERSSPGA